MQTIPNNKAENSEAVKTINNPLDAGFFNTSIKSNGLNGFEAPDYQSRYNWFVSEFVQYNIEIPDALKTEYHALFLLFGQEGQNASISARLEKYKVNISDEIPMPEIVLSICDSDGNNKRMVMTRQNISCITAQAKVGKTFLVKLIVGSVLQKGLFQNRLYSELPAGRDRVLYIDTEQSKFHVKLGLNQIMQILGDDYKDEFDRLDVYQFDSVSTLERLEFVKHLVYNNNYDLVIIDGISDLSLDTNNLKDADELVTNLRIWATDKDLHIINIIHLNPTDIATKMKGHLGTKLMDKSEIVISVAVDKENESNRIVQSMASRNRKPDPFQFSISEHGIPNIENVSLMDFQITGKRASKTEKPDFELFQLITSHFSKQSDLGNKYSELVTGISFEYEKRYKSPIGDNLTKKLITRFVDEGWILKSSESGNQKYFIGEFKTEPTTTFFSNPEDAF